MDLMKKIWNDARSNKKKIVLPEGNEERNIAAAEKIHNLGLAYPILVGNKEEIMNMAKTLDVNLSGIEIVDPDESDNLNKYITAFYELRKKKGMTMEKADKIVRDPLYFGTMMVKLDDADGLVSDYLYYWRFIKTRLTNNKDSTRVSVVSSFFIMQVPGSTYGEEGALIFADCAVNPNPNEDQLAAIAIATAETAKRLCNMEPKVAMLSFSTKGMCG